MGTFSGPTQDVQVQPVGGTSRQAEEASNFGEFVGSLKQTATNLMADQDKQDDSVVGRQRVAELKDQTTIWAESVKDKYLEDNPDNLTASQLRDIAKTRNYEDNIKFAMSLSDDRTAIARIRQAQNRIGFLQRNPGLYKEIGTDLDDFNIEELIAEQEQDEATRMEEGIKDIRDNLATWTGDPAYFSMSGEEVLKVWRDKGFAGAAQRQAVAAQEADIIQNQEELNVGQLRKSARDSVAGSITFLVESANQILTSPEVEGQESSRAQQIGNLFNAQYEQLRNQYYRMPQAEFDATVGKTLTGMRDRYVERATGKYATEEAQSTAALFKAEAEISASEYFRSHNINPVVLRTASDLLRNAPWSKQIASQKDYALVLNKLAQHQMFKQGVEYNPYNGVDSRAKLSETAESNARFYETTTSQWDELNDNQRSAASFALANDLNIAENINGLDSTELRESALVALSSPVAIKLVQHPDFQKRFNPNNKQFLTGMFIDKIDALAQLGGGEDITIDLQDDGSVVANANNPSVEVSEAIERAVADVNASIRAQAHLNGSKDYSKYARILFISRNQGR